MPPDSQPRIWVENKKKRLKFAKKILSKFEREMNGDEWLDQVLTVNESWFYHKKIGKKQETCTCKRQGEPPDTIERRSRYDVKTMVCVLFR